jgi:hypothetical protein
MKSVLDRSFLFLVVGLLMSGCVTAEAINKYPVGTIVRDAVVLGPKQIPLPPGNWEVYGSAEAQTGFSSPVNVLVLANAENKRLPRAVTIFANVAGASRGTGGWTSLKACSRKDMHHRVTEVDTTGGDQACWFINHGKLTRTNRTPKYFRDALDRVIAKGRKLPLTSIYVEMRVADTFDYLTVRYYFNPESDGFEPPNTIGH